MIMSKKIGRTNHGTMITISECGKICHWWYWWIPGRWQPIEWGTFVPMECETNPSFYSKMVGVHHGQLFAGLWLLILYDPHCLPANFCFFKHEPLHRNLPHFLGAKRFGEPSFIAETELAFGQEISSFYRCKVVPRKLTQRMAELWTFFGCWVRARARPQRCDLDGLRGARARANPREKK